jgi:hypothetical protein
MVNHPNRQVGRMTVQKLRQMYHETWGLEWPEDDSYLRELWSEARQSVQSGMNKVPPPSVYARCIEAMRENHSF